MSLYALQKKIQERLDFEIEFTKNDPEPCSKRIGNAVCASYHNQLKELNEEIALHESRVSQLEKKRIVTMDELLLHCLDSQLSELRGVLGKK